jgi:effector-binding domain-containing protein
MKKPLLIAALVVVVAAIASVYVMIPSQLEIVQITPVQSSTNATFRNMASADKWQAWWPKNEKTGETPEFRGDSYYITKSLANTIALNIDHEDLNIGSTIYLVPLSGDSTGVQWECTIPTSANPFARIKKYRQAVAVKDNMAGVLQHLKQFAEKTENVYGFPITTGSYKDTLMITSKCTTAVQPNNAAIMKMIASVKQYAASQQVQQTGNPIYNVMAVSEKEFQLMVGLPVNKLVKETNEFYARRMVAGKFLVTQVTGGDSTVQKAFKQLQAYMRDYKKTAMAIPFNEMVTDRPTEPDTSKWVTRIYFPIF